AAARSDRRIWSCRLDPEGTGELARRVDLADAGQVGGKADRIAAAIAGRKIGPPAIAIDFEAAEAPIRAPWIARYVFGACPVAIRQPTRQQRREGDQRRGVDRREIDPAAGLGHLRHRAARTPTSLVK